MLSVTGQNDAPVLTTAVMTVYDIQGGQPTPVEHAFDGIRDIDTPASAFQVYAIDGVIVTSFPATATGSTGGTFTVEATGDVSFKDTGNQLTSGETSVITLTITDGFGGFVNKDIGVHGL